MPPMHGQIHHVAWLEMDGVPDAGLAEGSIDVMTFVGMRVEFTLGGQGGRRARSEGLGASCQEAGGRECVEVATHPHAVLVNMHPVIVVRAIYLTDIASDNDHRPGLRVVMLILEVSVDICLGLQPGWSPVLVCYGAPQRAMPRLCSPGAAQ